MSKVELYSELFLFFFLPVVLFSTNVLSPEYRHAVLFGVSLLLFFLALRRHWFNNAINNITKEKIVLWILTGLTCVVGVIAWSTIMGNPFAGWEDRSYVLWYILIVSFLQEFVFRKYLHNLLLELTGNKVVIVFVVSLLFGGIHLIYPEPLTAFILSFGMSVLFSSTYLKAPSLILASIAHAFVNFVAVGYCIVALQSVGCA